MSKRTKEILGVEMIDIEMPVFLAEDLFRFLGLIRDNGDQCQLHQGSCKNNGICHLELERGFIGTAIIASTLPQKQDKQIGGDNGRERDSRD